VSTTPPDLIALLAKYGEVIRVQHLGRAAVCRLTGLGENRARRLLQLVNSGMSELDRRADQKHHGSSEHRATVAGVREMAEAAPEPEGPISVETAGDACTVSSDRNRISTPEELLARAGIDQTLWLVERVKLNNWEMGSTPRLTGSTAGGWERKDNAVNVTPLYSIQIWLKRRLDVINLRQMKEDALAEMKTAASALPAILPPARTRGPEHLLYLGAHDIHIGKYAAVEQTRQAYTLDIATRMARDTMLKLLERSAGDGIDRILLPVGHDLTHFENASYQTSAGTPQDPAGSYREMRRYAYELMVRMIEDALQFAPVDVEAVPGNHGRDTDLGIAERLEARFHNNPHVRVRASLLARPYYIYGRTLLGLTHGDRMKPESLPLIMADEMPQAWAECPHREWLLGHFHAKKTYQVIQSETEVRGVRVRYLPSISALDWYHAVSGYGNVRAMEAYLYHLTEGYVGHRSVGAVERAA
jgi:hypothetical protein